MTIEEIVSKVDFMLGLPTVELEEGVQTQQAVLLAFEELKSYMKTPVNKTVPYSPRLDLKELGIHTVNILYVQAAYPRIGLTLSSIDSGNVFAVAAAVNTYGAIGQTSSLNIDPILTEMGMAQVRNTIGTDFQWTYDIDNQVVYCTHRAPVPSVVTIRYVPEYTDVSEIKSHTWIKYLIRLSEAYMKLSLGRARSKYKVSDSNVELDGDTLLSEAQSDFETIRSELEAKKNRIVVLN